MSNGVCVDKLPHDCGTRDGLQVFADPSTGKVDGFCFSCRKYIPNPYGKEKTLDQIDFPPPKSDEEIKEEMAEVLGYPTVDLKERKLRAEDLKSFGIKVSLDETDGKTPSATYFPMYIDNEHTGYYVKTLSQPTIQYTVGNVKKAQPFNWQNAKKSGAYKLIITEGREDAVAVTSLFRRYNTDEKWTPAVIALPNGVNSVKSSLSQIAQEIKNMFKEVIICFDNDEAGQKATEEAMLIIPKAKVATLPEKDANDCILKGASKAAYNALAFQASPPKNTRLIISGRDLHLKGRTPTPYGELTWPFPRMNRVMRNIRLGETVYLGSGVKMGKSELVDTLGAHFIQEDGVKIFMAKPEQNVEDSYKRLCGKVTGKIFHDPDVEFDFDAYDKAGKIISDNAFFVDLYQHLGWETLQQDIISAANMSAKAVFIDPITNLTAGVDSATANTMLTGIARDLSAMAKDLNIVVFVFCHLKAPEGNISADVRNKKYREGTYYRLGNCPHERGGDVLSSQFAGSRAMMQACDLMLALEGNKDDQLPENIRNLRYLSILEDRQFGNTESIPLFYNQKSAQYKEA
jgi:twinkle protein